MLKPFIIDRIKKEKERSREEILPQIAPELSIPNFNEQNKKIREEKRVIVIDL